MRPCCIRVLAGVTLACLFSPIFSFAEPPDRLRAALDNNRRSVLHGNMNPLARPEYARGLVDAERLISGVSLDLQPTAEQQAALDMFLEAQRDPGSPDYQHFLTPEEFGDRFGISECDLARLTFWLTAQGLTIDHVGEARNWIMFSGTAGQIGRAFQTSLRYYEVNGETHFANDTEPSMPAALSEVVRGIRCLDDFRPRPGRNMMRTAPVMPDFNSSNGGHSLAPDDIAKIYNLTPLYQASYDGLGQKLVIAGQTDINLSDLRAFRSQFGLTARDPQIVLAGADPGTSQGDLIEATLDLEWSGAVARNATLIYVNSNNVFTSVQYAINQNLAPVISLSYGACETSSQAGFRSVAQQAAAQGITWMTASGDQGAAGCDYGAGVATHGPAVSFPADIPEIVAVGGTEFAETSSSVWATQNGTAFGSALSYIPETAWNDTATSGELSASGGGMSAIFSKPWWQTGPGVPNDGQRDVPDVALSASGRHDGYLIYTGGALMTVGGTSAAAPAFAGMVALLNQYLVARGTLAKPGLGNLNPALYALAQSSTGVFHDITTGDNIVPCKTGTTGCATGSFGYKAGPGYDLVTGLGSLDAYNMVTKWTSLPAGVGTTTSLRANPATISASGTTQLLVTVAPVSGSNTPNGVVTFTTAGGTTLGSAPLTATEAGGTAALTVKGSSLAAGANTITASYTATGSFRNSTGTTTVTVTATVPVATTTSMTANPASLAVTASTVLTVTVKPATGTAAPGGSVVLTAGNSVLGTATLTAGTASFTVKGTALATGSNNLTATYTATGNFGDSAGSMAVTITQPLTAVPTSVTMAASSVSIAATGTTVVTATVRPASGTAAPGGTVAFFAGSKALGTETLKTSGSAATAAITVAASVLVTGNNSITATYSGATGFSGSPSSVLTVNVAPVPVATTTSAAAASASLTQSATTQVTVTVKSVSGKTVPTGSVTLARGSVALGTATLTAIGSVSPAAVATFSLKGTALAAGSNTLTAVYSGGSGFTGSEGTVVVTMQASATGR